MTDKKRTVPVPRKNKQVALDPEFNEILNSQLSSTIWPYCDHQESKERYEKARKYIAESKLKNAWQFLSPEKKYRVYKLNLAEVDAAERALQSIDSKDTIEAMLATQMVSLHFATMQALHMAATSVDSYEERTEYLKNAAKLAKTFSSLVNARTNHRSKGKIKQEIIVQHIQLEGGAQAVIGGKMTHKGRGVEKDKKQPCTESGDE